MRILILIPIAALLLVTGCDSFDAGTLSQSELQSAQPAPINIDGAWNYDVEVLLVFPGFVAPDFGYEQEGPILRLNCTGTGTAVFEQDGSTITGTLSENYELTSCVTGGGQVGGPPWPPGDADWSGDISGRSIKFVSEPDAAGISCTANGALKEVVAGSAMEIHTNGGCDLSSFPFRPAHAKNSAVYTRQ
jgi:hypothetical protein